MGGKPTVTRPHLPVLSKLTKKQIGDAAEQLIAGRITLAGTPTLKVPDNWPAYDLIAQPCEHGPPQPINVKARCEKDTHPLQLVLTPPDDWDWFAFVWISNGHERPRCWLIPKEVALPDKPEYETGDRHVTWKKLTKGPFARFEDNFTLSLTPTLAEPDPPTHRYTPCPTS